WYVLFAIRGHYRMARVLHFRFEAADSHLSFAQISCGATITDYCEFFAIVCPWIAAAFQCDMAGAGDNEGKNGGIRSRGKLFDGAAIRASEADAAQAEARSGDG
ncbi:hypothetical protein, partial [Burkholderia ubonensis]|uniref:hypothetical protein n=1 Tax=Burkholderia ubonensis TaxID=101571 RepID=UPI001E505049